LKQEELNLRLQRGLILNMRRMKRIKRDRKYFNDKISVKRVIDYSVLHPRGHDAFAKNYFQRRKDINLNHYSPLLIRDISKILNSELVSILFGRLMRRVIF